MGAGHDPTRELLSALPPVHELAAELGGSHQIAVNAARQAIAEQRAALLAGHDLAEPGIRRRARQLMAELSRPSLRRVINATGVLIHTNLGRAPLAAAARDAVAEASRGYLNLELDLVEGSRGSRHDHVSELMCELTAAQDAIVVNNGAAAVLLAAAALAGDGRGVIVSRGQLVEIGGGFRIPEVVAQSGARLVEVGTTNRTRLEDYERAVASVADVAAILRVHQSNFRTLGFVEDVAIDELCGLGVAVIDDVGSGVVSGAVGLPALADEPSVARSLRAGAALVCCSGDKLLGGPQAGLLLGRRDAVQAARRHPLARAMRIDKLSLAALEATLRLYRDPERARREIPVLAMLDCGEEELAARARTLADAIGQQASLTRVAGRIGGGALPLLELEGPAVALDASLDPVVVTSELRRADPPVIARIHDGQVLLDPRTIADEEVALVAAAAAAAISPAAP